MDQINAEKSKPQHLDFESKKQELGMMARSLKMYYASRKVSNMFICQVIDYLFKSTFGSLLEKGKYFLFELKKIFLDKIHDLVICLCKWLPEWLTIVENNGGTILRMDKGYDYNLVMGKMK
jgi:hypothetical protein